MLGALVYASPQASLISGSKPRRSTCALSDCDSLGLPLMAAQWAASVD
jgi:hypothetical protein